MSVTVLHEHTFIDKTTWDDGPWQSEPDKVQWRDEATGYPCLAVRNARGGYWCGYVGVTEGHPSFEKDYEDVVEESTPDADEYLTLDVHGGLTYSGFCQEGADAEERGICYVPRPAEPERVWWLGFDCAHGGDFSPRADSYLIRHTEMIAPLPLPEGDEYRTLEYVQGQCAGLAAQLKQMAKPPRRQSRGRLDVDL